ncbi:MAG TPA: hypothetical protein VFV58_34825 [Blastocatellia bacterium]|nr:hypothetical protein [Blastocatellia bacterium]
MELEQLLQTLYPDGAPSRVIAFLDGSLARDDAYDEIVSASGSYLDEHQRIENRRSQISGTVIACNKQIADINQLLDDRDYVQWEADWLAGQLQKKQALEFIISRATQEVVALRSNPQADRDQAEAWRSLRSLAEERREALTPGVDSMSVVEMLELLFPEKMPTMEHPGLLPIDLHRESRLAQYRWKIEELSARFDRGEISGNVRAEIFGIRQRYLRAASPADARKRDACTRLLQIAEEKQPTPYGATKYS